MKVASAARLDEIDLARLRGMVASAPFQLLQARIQGELTRALTTCERSDSAIEVSRAQGAAAALRTALGLPAKIVAEVERNA
jgi:hypothetical protein